MVRRIIIRKGFRQVGIKVPYYWIKGRKGRFKGGLVKRAYKRELRGGSLAKEGIGAKGRVLRNFTPRKGGTRGKVWRGLKGFGQLILGQKGVSNRGSILPTREKRFGIRRKGFGTFRNWQGGKKKFPRKFINFTLKGFLGKGRP